MRPRPLRRALTAAVLIPLMVLLSGCIKMTAEFDVRSEQDIAIVVDVAVRKSAVEALGMEANEFSRPESFCVPTQGGEQTRTSPYTDDTWIGCRSEGKGKADSDGISLKDDVWTFELTPAGLATSSGGAQGLTPSSFDEFRVAVSFPGKVLSHSGSSTVKGTTVTWTDANDLLTGEGLKATAENGGTFPLWAGLAIGAGVLGLGAGAWVLLARRRTLARAAANESPQYPQPYPQASPQYPQPYPQASPQYPQSPQQYPQASQQYPPQQYSQASQQYPPQQYPGPEGPKPSS